MRQTAIALLFTFVAVSAGAHTLGETLGQASRGAEQSCVAVGVGASTVAAVVANPADCCTGRMACAQFLSTTRVVRPAHEQRT